MLQKYEILRIVLCIVSMIRYVSSIHWSDTRYVSRYVSYHLLNKNIAETVIKLKSHMFQANIEAGIEHVCNIRNRNFRNSPWHLGQGNLLTILFIADNLTCTMSRQLWHNYGSHQSQGTACLTLGPKVMTVTVIRVMYSSYKIHVGPTMYIHITMLPENGDPAYRIYVWRIPTIKYGYAAV